MNNNNIQNSFNLLNEVPNIQPINNISNLNNINNNINQNININLQPINLPNNFQINHENNNNNINENFNIYPQNNNIASSINLIKSTFLDDQQDFGEPMSFHQIDNLPIYNYPKKEIYDEKCSLCEFPLCFNDRVTKLDKCQHIFHKECLGNFLMHNKASKCPACKVSII